VLHYVTSEYLVLVVLSILSQHLLCSDVNNETEEVISVDTTRSVQFSKCTHAFSSKQTKGVGFVCLGKVLSAGSDTHSSKPQELSINLSNKLKILLEGFGS